MFKNYLRIAVRNMSKHRIYSTINILGLSIGISAAFGIFLFIKTELSYDAYHVNKNKIYRVIRVDSENGETGRSSYTPGPLGPALKKDFSQVVGATRFWGGHRAKIRVGDSSFEESNIAYMDPDALQMFTFPFVSGDRHA